MQVCFQQGVLGNVVGHKDITVAHAKQEPPEGLLQGGNFSYELLAGHGRLCRLLHLFLLVEIGHQECDSHTEHDASHNQYQRHDQCNARHVRRVERRSIRIHGVNTPQIRVKYRRSNENDDSGQTEDDTAAKVVLKPLFLGYRTRQGLGKQLGIDNAAFLDLLEKDFLLGPENIPPMEILEFNL